MGWFSKLKKKISIKNVFKGLKKALPYVPGGDLIKDGLNIAEQTAKVVFRKERKINVPQGRGTAVEPQVYEKLQAAAAPAAARQKNQNQMIMLAGAAALVLFLVMRK